MRSDLGPRKYPIIKVTREDARELLRGVPGVREYHGEISAPLDAIEVACNVKLPRSSPLEIDGDYDLDQQLKTLNVKALSSDHPLRDYQLRGAAFLARRAIAILSFPTQTGKTPTAISATLLAGSLRNLVICPAAVKHQWAEEIYKFTGEHALMLEGKAAKDSRELCELCHGQGCKPCRFKGSTPVHFDDLMANLRSRKWVIINYDIMSHHKATTDAGFEYTAKHLPGWAQTLSKIPFDVAIMDEAHRLRGQKSKRRPLTRKAISKCHSAWALTATPYYAFTRDVWGIIDTVTDGMWGGAWTFMRRYCDPQKTEYEWDTTGNSALAESELKPRLQYFMLLKKRSEILPDLPPKVRIPVRLTAAAEGTETMSRLDEIAQQFLSRSGGGSGSLLQLRTVPIKVAAIIENLESVLAETKTSKSIVFGYYRKTVELAREMIAKKLDEDEDLNVAIFSATGEQSDEQRRVLAKQFRTHEGRAVMICTIDCYGEGISLAPADSVHFIELHWSPSAIIQAEGRPYLPGVTRGLSIFFYQVQNSIDHAIANRLWPRFEMLCRQTDDEDAATAKIALDTERETEDRLQTFLASWNMDDVTLAED